MTLFPACLIRAAAWMAALPALAFGAGIESKALAIKTAETFAASKQKPPSWEIAHQNIQSVKMELRPVGSGRFAGQEIRHETAEILKYLFSHEGEEISLTTTFFDTEEAARHYYQICIHAMPLGSPLPIQGVGEVANLFPMEKRGGKGGAIYARSGRAVLATEFLHTQRAGVMRIARLLFGCVDEERAPSPSLGPDRRQALAEAARAAFERRAFAAGWEIIHREPMRELDGLPRMTRASLPGESENKPPPPKPIKASITSCWVASKENTNSLAIYMVESEDSARELFEILQRFISAGVRHVIDDLGDGAVYFTVAVDHDAEQGKTMYVRRANAIAQVNSGRMKIGKEMANIFIESVDEASGELK